MSNETQILKIRVSIQGRKEKYFEGINLNKCPKNCCREYKSLNQSEKARFHTYHKFHKFMLHIIEKQQKQLQKLWAFLNSIEQRPVWRLIPIEIPHKKHDHPFNSKDPRTFKPKDNSGKIEVTLTEETTTLIIVPQTAELGTTKKEVQFSPPEPTSPLLPPEKLFKPALQTTSKQIPSKSVITFP